MREPDRRAVRRQETIDEILAAAVELMAKHGVAALSLAEVARRVGVRPPSLYQYFPSKLAVYDALFARGMHDLDVAVRSAVEAVADPVARIRAGAEAYVAWSVAHPVQAQIMFWRPVPGFTPSAEAYGPALATLEVLRAGVRDAVDAGRLTPAAATEEGIDVLTTITAGIVSQQLSNQPEVTTPDGRFARLTPDVLDLYLAVYGTGRDRP